MISNQTINDDINKYFHTIDNEMSIGSGSSDRWICVWCGEMQIETSLKTDMIGRPLLDGQDNLVKVNTTIKSCGMCLKMLRARGCDDKEIDQMQKHMYAHMAKMSIVFSTSVWRIDSRFQPTVWVAPVSDNKLPHKMPSTMGYIGDVAAQMLRTTNDSKEVISTMIKERITALGRSGYF